LRIAFIKNRKMHNVLNFYQYIICIERFGKINISTCGWFRGENV